MFCLVSSINTYIICFDRGVHRPVRCCSTERHSTRCLSAHLKRTTRPGLTTDDLPPAPRNLAPGTRPPRLAHRPYAAALYRYPLACLALLLLYAAPCLQACIDRRRTGSPETGQHTTDNITGLPLVCNRCTARLLHYTATHERLSRRPTVAALPRCTLVVLAAATLSRCGAQDAERTSTKSDDPEHQQRDSRNTCPRKPAARPPPTK